MAERWALGLLLASLALLPFGRAAEHPMALAALAGVGQAVRGDWRGVEALHPAWLLGFAAYWLPELLSAADSLDPGRSWREVALDLRYLPMLGFFIHSLRGERAQRRLQTGIALLLALWLLDALLQAATGWSLGGADRADRLSGIFGAEDLKLGPVLAVLAPFLLLPAARHGRALLLLALATLLLVVLLAGTRAAWLMLAVALVALLLPRWGWRRSLAALLVTGVLAGLLGSLAYRQSADFAARIDRSAVALAGDRAAIDHALAFRLPIWDTALAMFAAHPLNGVGVRAFRVAYPQFAAADDPWVGFMGDGDGAAHAHQLLLELLSETGVLGVLCWLSALIWLLAQWRQAGPAARRRAEPAGVALVAMLFPLNTHYAMYSSAWGGLLLVLLAVWLAAWLPPARTPSAGDSGTPGERASASDPPSKSTASPAAPAKSAS